MKLHIRIAGPVMEALRAYHLREGKRAESLSYIWARAVFLKDRILVLVPHSAPMKLFAPDCFLRQSGGNVQLEPDVLNGMLVNFAASDYNCLINIHDHWFDEYTCFSRLDDADDATFDSYLRGAFEPMLKKHPHIGPARKILNLSMVLAQKGVDARLTDTKMKQRFLTASTVDVNGEQFERMVVGIPAKDAEAAEMFCRQADFIPVAKQNQLAQMHVTLAGCGGLGSILAESLARVGVGGLTLIDDDVLEASNLNRWQGGNLGMIGKSKVDLLGANLRRMFPDLCVQTIAKSLYDPAVESEIGKTDILVGGLDNDEARYFLSRVSMQYGVPYFDAGVAVTGSGDDLDMRARYFAVIPGVTRCIECTQIDLYDRDGTINAFLDAATAKARREAGYVIDMPQAETPSVYAINQRAAALLVMELLNHVCGWRPLATSINESWRYGTFERLSRDIFPEKPDPECPICSYYAGAGQTEPLPRPLEFRWQPTAKIDHLVPIQPKHEEKHHG